MKRMWTVGVGVVALALAAGCAGSSEAKRDAEGAVAGLEDDREGMVVDVKENYVSVQDVEIQVLLAVLTGNGGLMIGDLMAACSVPSFLAKIFSATLFAGKPLFCCVTVC